jgi:hypothetical protein
MWVYQSLRVLNIINRVNKRVFSNEQFLRYEALVEQIIRFQGNAGHKLVDLGKEIETYIERRMEDPRLGYDVERTFVHYDEPRAHRNGKTVVYVAYQKGPPRFGIKTKRHANPELVADDITIYDTNVVTTETKGQAK